MKDLSSLEWEGYIPSKFTGNSDHTLDKLGVALSENTSRIMEPHGHSPWYLHDIPSYALGPGNPSVRKSHGFGGLSAGGEIRRSSSTSAQE